MNGVFGSRSPYTVHWIVLRTKQKTTKEVKPPKGVKECGTKRKDPLFSNVSLFRLVQDLLGLLDSPG